MYQLCLDCHYGRPVAQWEAPVTVPTQKKLYRLEYSDAWTDGYMMPSSSRFFVYIVEFDDGNLHVGHTKDLRKQLAGYLNRKTSPTVPAPKLQYVELAATERDAELRQAELEKLIGSNPQQIQMMISEFHRLMREFGLEE